MKDIGAANFILGIEIKINQENKKICLNQRKHVESIMWMFNVQECKPTRVPIHVGVNLSIDRCMKTQEEEEDVSHVLHASGSFE
jgi:hypothetical protein